MAFFDCTYDYSIIVGCSVDVQDINEANSLVSQVAEQLGAVVSLENFEEGESYAYYKVEYDGDFRVTADRDGCIEGITDDGDVENEAIDRIEGVFAMLGHKCLETELIDSDIPSFEHIHADIQIDISDYHERRRTGCLGYDD